jgi:hypothetical protein
MNGLKRGFAMITGAATDSATAYKQTAIHSLDKLDQADRLEVLRNYCSHCGEKKSPCNCWRDE